MVRRSCEVTQVNICQFIPSSGIATVKYQKNMCNKVLTVAIVTIVFDKIAPAKGKVYGTAKKKRPGYLVGNLVATNWPIKKALHAIGYNQIPTK